MHLLNRFMATKRPSLLASLSSPCSRATYRTPTPWDKRGAVKKHADIQMEPIKFVESQDEQVIYVQTPQSKLYYKHRPATDIHLMKVIIKSSHRVIKDIRESVSFLKQSRRLDTGSGIFLVKLQNCARSLRKRQRTILTAQRHLIILRALLSLLHTLCTTSADYRKQVPLTTLEQWIVMTGKQLITLDMSRRMAAMVQKARNAPVSRKPISRSPGCTAYSDRHDLDHEADRFIDQIRSADFVLFAILWKERSRDVMRLSNQVLHCIDKLQAYA